MSVATRPACSMGAVRVVGGDIQLLPTLVYSMSFTSLRFGMGAAMGLLSLVFIALPLYFYLRAVKLDTGTDSGAKK